MPVINKLPSLIGRKQQVENRVIGVTELSQETGISRDTIHKWLNGEATRFDGATIEAFCKYFGCDVGDLLTIMDREAELA